MIKLTYEELKGSPTIVCRVRRDKKIIGAIYTYPMGHYYRPTGGPCGETFKTVDEVKATL